jgi:stage V sporulation protein G
MEITEINVRLRNDRKLKAFVNVTFDNVFAIKGLKIISSKKGLLLCMPSRKAEDGTQRDIAHPITKAFRTKLEREVLTEYRRVSSRADRGEMVPENLAVEVWAMDED